MTIFLKYLNVLRGGIRARQNISDEIQTNIYLIRDALQNFIEKVKSCTEKNKGKFWLNIDGLQKC